MFDLAGQTDMRQLQLAHRLLESQQRAQGAMGGLDEAEIRNRYGSDLARNNLAGGFLGQDRGFNNQGFDLAKQMLDNARARELRLASESSTARGATVSHGYRSELGEIQGAHAAQLGQAGLARDRANAGLDAQAAKMGIDAGELRRGLDLAIGKLGLTGMLDAEQLGNMLSSNVIEQQGLAHSILRAGFPDFFQGSAPGQPGSLASQIAGDTSNTARGVGPASAAPRGVTGFIGDALGVPYAHEPDPAKRAAMAGEDLKNEAWWQRALGTLWGGIG